MLATELKPGTRCRYIPKPGHFGLLVKTCVTPKIDLEDGRIRVMWRKDGCTYFATPKVEKIHEASE